MAARWNVFIFIHQIQDGDQKKVPAYSSCLATCTVTYKITCDNALHSQFITFPITFDLYPGVEISRKGTVSAKFCPKLCGNCALLQNFQTRKLGKITLFYTVLISALIRFLDMDL